MTTSTLPFSLTETRTPSNGPSPVGGVDHLIIHRLPTPKLLSFFAYTFETEPRRVWRRLQLLRKWSHYEQDKEQVFF